VKLSAEQAEDLRRLSRGHGATLYMTLLAGFGALLGRYSGQQEVVVGTPIANRREADLEEMIGFFVNMLVMRAPAQGEMSFVELLAELRRVALEAYEHQDAPFERLVKELAPERSLNTTPLFQVVFALQNAPWVRQQMKGLEVEPVLEDKLRAGYDLETYVWEDEGEIGIYWLYNRDLFDRWRMERMARHYARMLEAAASNPEERIGLVELLTAEERRQILKEWNETVQAVPEVTLPALFEEQVEKTPEAVAVVCGEHELSYRELNRQANQLAHHLRRLGVGPDARVGICLERSVEMVVALLGALKAGGAYVPLDPAYPSERLAYMLEDSAPAVLLTHDAALAATAGRSPELPIVNLESDAWQWAGQSESNPDRMGIGVDARSLAYVIYTSGSTGTPKGVMNEHRGIVNRLMGMQRDYGLGERDAVLQKTPFSFDVSVWEFFWPLLYGARLVMALPGGHKNPSYLVRTVQQQSVTTMHFVPSMLQFFLEDGEVSECRNLARVICSGEALSAALAQRFSERLPDTQLYNLYGPTEAAIDVTAWNCRQGAASIGVPIGQPVDNTRIYILCALQQAAPIGVAGELYIGGMQVGRGYFNRPELTAERFLPDPFSREEGARVYRTGDLGRWLPEGHIEFLGRNDFQVKIRGFRIELGEIEEALRRQAGVSEAVVIAQEDKVGDKRLVGYVTPANGRGLDPRELREGLGQSLPEYMIPAAIVELERWPLTPSGKLDRRALPEPKYSVAQWRAARTVEEEALCALFAEVLGVERVGLDDHFFELGGDSIVSIRLVSRARKVGLPISPRDVFQYPRVEALAKAAQGKQQKQVCEPDLGVGEVTATPIMRQLEEIGGAIGRFSQSMLLRVPAGLRLEDLTAALQAILGHHDALRLRLKRGDAAEWELEIAPQGAINAVSCVRRVEIGMMNEEQRRACLIEEAGAACGRLNPEAGVMAQAVWFDAGTEEAGRLLLTIHHLAVDGVSWRILAPDLKSAWEAISQGREVELGAKGSSFRRWSRELSREARKTERVEEMAFWRETLGGPAVAITHESLDRELDTRGSARSLTLRLSTEATGTALRDAQAAFHAQINDILLTALSVAVLKWRKDRGTGNGVLIDLEGHGREEIIEGMDLTRTVGWFTNLYPVRLDPGAIDLEDALSGEDSMGRALKRIKEQLRRVPNGGLGYGLLRYLNEETKEELAELGKPQIVFNYLGRFVTAEDEDWGLAPEADTLGGGVDEGLPLSHCLEVNALTLDGAEGSELIATWSWAPRLLGEGEVRELAEGWFRAIEALVEHSRKPEAGGHTPSDLPLLALSQAEIERLEREHREWARLALHGQEQTRQGRRHGGNLK
jgi:amino acid adenylation domain-containing protein/non-ribosomal peptide synthase protein (TIGR01720 family)